MSRDAVRAPSYSPLVPIERIDDPADPRIADYRDLRDAELRRRQGLFIAESREVVHRLLVERRFRARSVLVTQPGFDGLREILEAAAARIPILLTRPEVVRAVAGFNFHRGCLAIGERGGEPSLDEIIGPRGPRRLLALENVTNPDNIGGLFRNAMAFGVDGVLLSAGSGDPLYRKAIRVAIGASLSIPFARAGDWPHALQRLRDTGTAVIALTPDGAAVDVAEFGATRSVPERAALLLGAEGVGLSAATRRAAHLEVRIPMRPGVDSLNVATAAGIALHRLYSSAG
jgi:tRNA G18 (ribose-2'-O)-methylase SpoU